jgi:choline dehydrogenase-like flavoprotein
MYRCLKTPQILELSGIGVRSVLNALEIPAMLDLPVGENVQEHILCGVTWGWSFDCFYGLTVKLVASELRDDVSFDTLDILHDPEVAAKHVELQYVAILALLYH